MKRKGNKTRDTPASEIPTSIAYGKGIDLSSRKQKEITAMYLDVAVQMKQDELEAIDVSALEQKFSF